jgi:hypothetical protein
MRNKVEDGQSKTDKIEQAIHAHGGMEDMYVYARSKYEFSEKLRDGIEPTEEQKAEAYKECIVALEGVLCRLLDYRKHGQCIAVRRILALSLREMGSLFETASPNELSAELRNQSKPTGQQVYYIGPGQTEPIQIQF